MSQSSSRVVVHDYSGHPGQAQLSRALAGRGYEVTHQHCPSYATGKGSLERTPDDPPTLKFEACAMGGTFNKYSFATRLRQEFSYGSTASRAILANRPDVVVLSNVPLIAHARIARRLARRGVPTIFWQQDVYSEAIGATARKRLPSVLGRSIGAIAEAIERRIARRSSGVVAISPTFLEKLDAWGVADKTVVVPNWAPIKELPVRATKNAWRERMGLSERPVVLYSGTLGLKHDPSILALLADQLKDSHPEAVVVVISEGSGRQWLEEWKAQQQVDNLMLLDFQSYDDLPEVLASADILVAILEPDASRFSVPSKVLTYLCAQRAILSVINPDNAVAEVLISNRAGVVVDPKDREAISAQAAALLDDHELRRVLGKSARNYAEREFCPERAADRFITLFGTHVAHPLPSERLITAAPASARLRVVGAGLDTRAAS
jgi:glycosyltransferase involved in cell wall biosynthesis